LTWQFVGLKRYLDVPLIGLQSPSLSGLPMPESMTALAGARAERIGSLAPTGPIRLLGWSFVGALAVCAAAELKSRGREVTFVGMLDSRRSAAVGDVASLLVELGFATVPGESTVEDAVALIRTSDEAISSLTDTQIGLVVENYLSSDRLMAAATYPAYDGRIFLIDATVSGAASADWADLPRLEVYGLPVAHSEVLDPATLEDLGPC
jgi:thioesterase domain-containing protein